MSDTITNATSSAQNAVNSALNHTWVRWVAVACVIIVGWWGIKRMAEEIT